MPCNREQVIVNDGGGAAIEIPPPGHFGDHPLSAARPAGTMCWVEISLVVRDVAAEDLAALEWTGGPEHLRAVAAGFEAAASGEVAQLVVALPNGCLIGFGAVDFRRSENSGTLWMLSVHDTWQSLGVGRLLIDALESRILARGREAAIITVEHDNPRARALYRRLGYVEAGSELDGWSIGRGRSYVTVCTVLRRRLR